MYNRLDDECLSNTANGDSDVPFQNEPVLKVSSGRGRGMINKKFRPGGFSDDNAIKKDLRRIAPLGYSNEVTELAINSKITGKSEDKLENTLQQPISQILQGSKKKRDSAYRSLLKQKEQQIWNETMANERKIKELFEQDQQQFYTDLEKSYDDSVGTDRRTKTSVNSDFPWGTGDRYSNRLNLKSSSDFPPLSGGKKSKQHITK